MRIEFNLRFAGQYENSENGYYYNWHRYYNPKTGRYSTSDPIGLNGGLNTYGYAGANPVSSMDPWGLFIIFIGGAGDHEPFAGIGQVGVIGPTGITERVRRDFRDKVIVPQIKQAGHSDDKAKELAISQAHYYGYNQLGAALTNAKLFFL